MKRFFSILAFCLIALLGFTAESCDNSPGYDKSTTEVEQDHTESNQQNLNTVQPAPTITWSLERDNLIKRFRLQNDRAVVFYMYVFIEGVSQPVGYYQVNKVSSVNSQLTNPMQLKTGGYSQSMWSATMPSPAEDGSYGDNGDAVFGFTPQDIYIEHNMKYMASTVPLSFTTTPKLLTVISVENEQKLRAIMSKIH